MPGGKLFSSEEISIFRLKIYICSLKIRICNLKICIFSLKIEIRSDVSGFVSGVSKFWEEENGFSFAIFSPSLLVYFHLITTFASVRKLEINPIKMSLRIIVLAKQVPDTRNVGKDAMKEDGTINRAALPAIFNPEDLNALEQALRLKDTHPGWTGPRGRNHPRRVISRGRRRLPPDRPRLCRRRHAGNLVCVGYGYPENRSV